MIYFIDFLERMVYGRLFVAFLLELYGVCAALGLVMSLASSNRMH